jgi:hypothetical protein
MFYLLNLKPIATGYKIARIIMEPNFKNSELHSKQYKNAGNLNDSFPANSNNGMQAGENLNNLGYTLQKNPAKINQRQVEINARLNKLAEINENIIGRWGMSKSGKELLRIDSQADKEALQIIRKGENDDLAATADYQTRYLKAILHNLVLVGESNITGAAKLLYENAKIMLHEKLLIKAEEMTYILEDVDNRAMKRPEKFQNFMLGISDSTLNQWGRDFDLHLNEFADLLKRTFSR